ncbi:MAG: GNAT family N-acetyltransferase [Clostridia bacterium]|nr:GNAT family N-acetyltransferase [Clostridia bacterium]
MVDELSELVWVLKPHRDLSDAEKQTIARLKDQHWRYGLASQLDWMERNLTAGDTHVMGLEPTGAGFALRAYATVTPCAIRLDGRDVTALGVGGVCVDQRVEHTGCGKKLLRAATAFIEERGQPGILLCRDALVPFYRKCGWSRLPCQTATVAGAAFGHNVMTTDDALCCTSFAVDKNF